MSDLERRLDRLRGDAPPRNHTARTIAALTTNPGCARRAVTDAAGVDKDALADRLGFPARTGQSRFAITRGNAFEAAVKADGCAALLAQLGVATEVPYTDLGAGGDRADRSRELLGRAEEALLDHPLLSLEVAGRRVHLEPDLIALQLGGRYHIVEIKSFAVIDGQADAEKVAAAARQSAVYVLALRRLVAELGRDPGTVSHEVILVCPENFSNRPIATRVDVRRQLTVLERQLSRLARIDELLAVLPPELTLDGAHGAAELAAALTRIEARYAPDCMAACELAFFCRDEAHRCGATDALGRTVRDDLGGLDSVALALGLADGTVAPAPEQAEIAARLAAARRIRAECGVA